MSLRFDTLELGQEYGRPHLARLWGYRRYNAIARGLITPARDNKIVLFITAEKQSHLTQYQDVLAGNSLAIEGETNHAADARLINASAEGDQVHLFYRARHHQDFTYYGEVKLIRYEENKDIPSRFWFSLDLASIVAEETLAADDERQGVRDNAGGNEEGRKRLVQSVRYERNVQNRADAIRHHGTVCKACQFDFDDFYGAEHARHFIQIHHLESVTTGVRKVNPKIDLVPLCSNCHSMAHRRRGQIFSVQKLQSLIAAQRGKRGANRA